MKKFDYSDAGKRIAEIRKSNHLTQDQLAELLDVSPAHISHVENASKKYSLNFLIKFCEICECSMDYITFGKTRDEALRQLPDEIVEILHSNNKIAQKYLYDYLNFFAKLYRR